VEALTLVVGQRGERGRVAQDPRREQDDQVLFSLSLLSN